MTAATNFAFAERAAFLVVRLTRSAALMSLRSPAAEHPLSLAQSWSCFRQAQSSLSIHFPLKSPPICLYDSALIALPSVQFGPHQRP